MKRFLVLMMLCASVWAQTPGTTIPPSSVLVNVKLGTLTRIWQFFFGVPTTITSFTCDRSATAADALLPGDSSTCTVTLNQAAGGSGVQIIVTVPTPLTGGPAGGILTIPSGSISGTFTVTYPSAPIAKIQLPEFFSAQILGDDDEPTLWIGLMPCCSLGGNCQVSLNPAWPPELVITGEICGG